MEIFVKDTNPFSISAGGALENVDLVEKYEMCDEVLLFLKLFITFWNVFIMMSTDFNVKIKFMIDFLYTETGLRQVGEVCASREATPCCSEGRGTRRKSPAAPWGHAGRQKGAMAQAIRRGCTEILNLFIVLIF